MAVEAATQRTLKASAETRTTPTISVIIPARNEASTIGDVISSIPVSSLTASGQVVEIIVVDNNSHDRTAVLAKMRRAKVVSEPRLGYGRALRTGFERARGQIIVMGDGDGTYPLHDLERFLAPIHEGQADVVTGTRTRGRIHPGAMPFLHRYVGVPVLTFILNLLFGLRLSDGHCGMRAIAREALRKMSLTTDGMAFATEMLIRAKQAGLRIVEVPIEYRPRPCQSVSKLRSLADGWQHLALMVKEFWALPLQSDETIPEALTHYPLTRPRLP